MSGYINVQIMNAAKITKVVVDVSKHVKLVGKGYGQGITYLALVERK